jgi:hypothetical protein
MNESYLLRLPFIWEVFFFFYILQFWIQGLSLQLTHCWTTIHHSDAPLLIYEMGMIPVCSGLLSFGWVPGNMK